MASSNGSIFRVTGHLCGEFTSFDVLFDLRLNKRLSTQSNREAGDLRWYRAHYGVIVTRSEQNRITTNGSNTMNI